MASTSSGNMSSGRVSISSDEVNVLVYRYLLDAGFRHAAFTFQAECGLSRSPFAQVELPPAALVTYLNKGLIFLYMETHLGSDGLQLHCDDHFSLLRPHEHAFPQEEPTRETEDQYEDMVNTFNVKKRKKRDEPTFPSESPKDSPAENSGDNSIENSDVNMSPVISPKQSPSFSVPLQSEILSCSFGDSQLAVLLKNGTVMLQRKDGGFVSLSPHLTDAAATAIKASLNHMNHSPTSTDRNRDQSMLSSAIDTIKWSHDGHFFAVSAGGSGWAVWTSEGNLVARGIEACSSVCWNEGHRLCLVTVEDKIVVVSVSADGGHVLAMSTEPIVDSGITVTDISWVNEASIAVALSDATLHVYQLKPNQEIETRKDYLVNHIGHVEPGIGIIWKLAKHKNYLVLGGNDGTLVIFDSNLLVQGLVMKALTEMSPIRLQSARSEITRIQNAHSDMVTDIAWNEYGLFASASVDGSVKVFHVDGKAVIQIVSFDNKEEVQRIHFPSSGTVFCSLQNGFKSWTVNRPDQPAYDENINSLGCMSVVKSNDVLLVATSSTSDKQLNVRSFRISPIQ